MPRVKYTIRLSGIDVRYADGTVDHVPWTELEGCEKAVLSPTRFIHVHRPRVPKSIRLRGVPARVVRKLRVRAFRRELKMGAHRRFWLCTCERTFWLLVVLTLGAAATIGVFTWRVWQRSVGAPAESFDAEIWLLTPLAARVEFLGAMVMLVSAFAAMAVGAWIAWHRHERYPAAGVESTSEGLRVIQPDGHEEQLPWRLVVDHLVQDRATHGTRLQIRSIRWRCLLKAACDLWLSESELRAELRRRTRRMRRTFAGVWVLGSAILLLHSYASGAVAINELSPLLAWGLGGPFFVLMSGFLARSSSPWLFSPERHRRRCRRRRAPQ